MTERFELQRAIPADAADIFKILCDPRGHVAIDASGMLQGSTGEPAGAVGDTFVIHMDREALGDLPMGKYDVTVTITGYEQDRFITWEVSGEGFPSIGHYYGYQLEPTEGGTVVTSIYDWSNIGDNWKATGAWQERSRSSAARRMSSGRGARPWTRTETVPGEPPPDHATRDQGGQCSNRAASSAAASSDVRCSTSKGRSARVSGSHSLRGVTKKSPP